MNKILKIRSLIFMVNNCKPIIKMRIAVREENPLKQGLKQIAVPIIKIYWCQVREENPLKQGLKP